MILATPIDPLFIAIPCLQKSASQGFQSCDQIFENLSYPQLKQLATLESTCTKRLNLICDVKQGWDESVFKINPTKLHTWLDKKLHRLALHIMHTDHLRPSSVAMPTTATATVTATETATATETTTATVTEKDLAWDDIHIDVKRLAADILCEYVCVDIENALLKRHDITPVVTESKTTGAAADAAADTAESTTTEAIGIIQVTGDKEIIGDTSSRASTKRKKSTSTRTGGARKKSKLPPVSKNQKSVLSFFSRKPKK
jgi:Ydr279p protein family (RNase H2 complex component) wHTH domain